MKITTQKLSTKYKENIISRNIDIKKKKKKLILKS